MDLNELFEQAVTTASERVIHRLVKRAQEFPCESGHGSARTRPYDRPREAPVPRFSPKNTDTFFGADMESHLCEQLSRFEPSEPFEPFEPDFELFEP